MCIRTGILRNQGTQQKVMGADIEYCQTQAARYEACVQRNAVFINMKVHGVLMWHCMIHFLTLIHQ